MPPTEPAPYQPTVANIERRDDDARKQRAAFLEELRAVTEKAHAEGRDRERERVAAWIRYYLAPMQRDPSRFDVTHCVDLFVTAVRTGKDPGR